jgi:hypothetical protein
MTSGLVDFSVRPEPFDKLRRALSKDDRKNPQVSSLDSVTLHRGYVLLFSCPETSLM